jgi:hypothetical protein
VTESSVVEAVPGDVLHFVICQDSTGGHAFVWPENLLGTMEVGGESESCSAQTFAFDGDLGWATTSGVSYLHSPGATPPSCDDEIAAAVVAEYLAQIPESVCIPPADLATSGLSAEICGGTCDDGSPGCELSIVLNEASFDAPASRISLRADLSALVDVDFSILGLSNRCTIDASASGAALDATLTFTPTAGGHRVTVTSASLDTGSVAMNGCGALSSYVAFFTSYLDGVFGQTLVNDVARAVEFTVAAPPCPG